MNIEVRDYKQEDFSFVNSILQESFSVSKREFHDSCFRELVVTCDGVVCGYLLLTKVLNPILGKYYYLVDYVCVDSKYRGNGLSKKLLERASEIAKEEEIYYLQLTCGRKRLAAHKVYLDSGFVMRDSDIFRKEIL